MYGAKKESEFSKFRSETHFKHNGDLYVDDVKKKQLINK